MPNYDDLAQALTSEGAAFGVFPQMGGRRKTQDVEAAKNIPVDILRGRVAGLLGAIPDLLNMAGRSSMPTETFGDTQYEPTKQLPYGSEHYLKTLPLGPTTQTGRVANEMGALVPLDPRTVVKAGKPVVSLLGNELTRGMYGNEGSLANVIPTAMKPKQIFIGENAKTWNKDAAQTAVEMEKAGAKPEDIWTTTGTFRGAEGKLRQEISDKYSTIKGGGSFEDVIMNAYDRGVERTRGTGQREYWQPYKTTVDDVLFHHNLSEAYPELMKIESQLTPTETGSKGQLMLTDKDLIMQIRPDLQGTKAESTMLHELQHGVQEKEGFAKGGSVEGVVKEANKEAEEIAKKLNEMPYGSPQYEETYKKFLEKRQNITVDQAHDMYKRLAGEAEARAVQSRMNMTDAERRAKFPYQSYDVPINKLIVRK